MNAENKQKYRIEKKTMTKLKGALYDDYVTCSGIMLKLGGNHSKLKTQNMNDMYLNEREYVAASLNDKSDFTFTTDEKGNFIIVDKRGKIVTADVGISRPKLGQVESSPVAIHGDRIRVSLITGCSGDCKFCGLNKIKYVVNDFKTIKPYIDYILKRDKNVSRLFITGGNPKEEDLGKVLKTLEQIIKEYTKRGIKKYDFMFAPRGLDKYFYESGSEREYEKFLLKLKEIGVTTVAVDMELSNQKILKTLAPFKYKIGTKNYLKTLELAVKILGPGSARSNIIVGLESHEDSINAVKSLLKIGVEPCLSPYEPYFMLPDIKKPTWEFLYGVYKDAVNLCEEKGIKLAPSKYATDTHNSVASARYIPLTLSEFEAFFNCVKAVKESIKREKTLK